ncbi:M15 family metallopeptidase [Candidatus Saccharibacteria bacterium]|nr:M15 family metallopeptidase [Candidatus Saccharibacteria bacterium]
MLDALVGAVLLVSGISTYGAGVSDVAQKLPPRPDQSTISCHDQVWVDENLSSVGQFKTQNKLAPFVSNMITESTKNGTRILINSAYRSCPEQEKLRISACGIGQYNQYQKPIDLCLPPTEPAGKSLHNEGLALDFACSGYSVFEYSPCYTWLKKNGSRFHLYEHRLEAWHWSTTGQ